MLGEFNVSLGFGVSDNVSARQKLQNNIVSAKFLGLDSFIVFFCSAKITRQVMASFSQRNNDVEIR